MAKFVRKHPDPTGSYRAAYKEGKKEDGTPTVAKTILIEGRTVYSTDDKKEIEFLRSDPEVVEVEKKKEKK